MLTRTVHNSVRSNQCKGKKVTAFHHVLQSHNCKSPLLRVLSVEFLIFSRLRSASPSAYGYQLCGERDKRLNLAHKHTWLIFQIVINSNNHKVLTCSTCISSVQDHLQIPCNIKRTVLLKHTVH